MRNATTNTMKRTKGAEFAVAWHNAHGDAAPENATRLRVVHYCVRTLGMDAAAAFALDTEVCRAHHGARDAFLVAMRALLYNLETNPPLRNVPAHRLAQMRDEEMRSGTVLEDVERAEAQREAHFEAMLQQRYDSVDSGRSVMRCRKCHSANLAFEQKQTRGADERWALSLLFFPSSVLPTAALCHTQHDRVRELQVLCIQLEALMIPSCPQSTMFNPSKSQKTTAPCDTGMRERDEKRASSKSARILFFLSVM